MFDFLKKVQASGKSQHATIRSDWENVLDELHKDMVSHLQNSLALISNSAGSGSAGKLRHQLQFRFKPNLSPNLQAAIENLKREDFEKIFQLTQQQNMDIYSIKNLGLPNKCLVYPIQNKMAPTKRALLVFEGPFLQERLAQTLERIRTILNAPPKETKRPQRQAPSSIVPPTIPKRMIYKTNINVIKSRLSYLEDADSLNPAEKSEMQNLREFIEHSMRSAFR